MEIIKSEIKTIYGHGIKYIFEPEFKSFLGIVGKDAASVNEFNSRACYLCNHGPKATYPYVITKIEYIDLHLVSYRCGIYIYAFFCAFDVENECIVLLIGAEISDNLGWADENIEEAMRVWTVYQKNEVN